MGHSLLSPSKAARWLNCTPSARLEALIPDTSSPYAEEGTLAHAIAENELRYLNNNIDCDTYLSIKSKHRNDALYDADMPDYIQEYVNFILNILSADNVETKLFVEQKLDLSKYIPDCRGTADAVIVSDSVLYICDLKYGKGVKVDAYENPQLKLYALGALDYLSFLYDIDKVSINIIQPRLSHVSSWEVSVKDLLDWSYEVTRKANEAFMGLGETKAGPWCKFCKCNPNCRKLAQQQLELAQYDFKQADFLTDKELVDIFTRSKDFKEWIDSVGEYIKNLLLQGGHVKGLKLVKSQTRRAWRDAEADKQAIEAATIEAGLPTDILYEDPSIKSFSVLEKAVGKKVFDTVYSKFIKSTEYKTVALESDKREAVPSSIEEDFFNL